jgi:toxin FitB
MNLIDSSAWIEYFAGGPNASFFASALENVEEVLVPTIVLYEVFKRVLQQRDERDALQTMAAMQQGVVASLDARIALAAARISRDHSLAMADSIILATARAHGATVWTQDEDFDGLPDVQYRKRKA